MPQGIKQTRVNPLKGGKVEELQKALVAKIDEQLKTEKPNIQYLDVLNRLLGTASNWLIAMPKV